MNQNENPPGGDAGDEPADIHEMIARDQAQFFAIMTAKYRGYASELAEVYIDFLGVFIVASFANPLGALKASADALLATDVAAIRRGQFQRKVLHGTAADPRRQRILGLAGEPLSGDGAEEAGERDGGAQPSAPHLGKPPR